jgi:hypothetical protein
MYCVKGLCALFPLLIATTPFIGGKTEVHGDELRTRGRATR